MSIFLNTRRRRRRFIPFAFVALLALLGAALVGCGANDDEEPTETATSAVETTVTGTATSGTSTATATPKRGVSVADHGASSPTAVHRPPLLV